MERRRRRRRESAGGRRRRRGVCSVRMEDDWPLCLAAEEILARGVGESGPAAAEAAAHGLEHDRTYSVGGRGIGGEVTSMASFCSGAFCAGSVCVRSRKLKAAPTAAQARAYFEWVSGGRTRTSFLASVLCWAAFVQAAQLFHPFRDILFDTFERIIVNKFRFIWVCAPRTHTSAFALSIVSQITRSRDTDVSLSDFSIPASGVRAAGVRVGVRCRDIVCPRRSSRTHRAHHATLRTFHCDRQEPASRRTSGCAAPASDSDSVVARWWIRRGRFDVSTTLQAACTRTRCSLDALASPAHLAVQRPPHAD